MAIAFDNTVQASQASGASIAPALSTTNANDVLVVCIAIGSGTISVTGISGTNTTGWTLRKRITFNAGADSMEVWYGTNTAVLTSTTITVSLSGSTAPCSIGIMAFSGANLSTIADLNSSLPANATGSTGTPSVSGVSTSNANDAIFAFAGYNGTGVQTAATGFTLRDNPVARAPATATETEIVSAVQSNITVAFGTANGAAWGIIVDAINAAGTGNPIIVRPPLKPYLRR